MAHNADIREVEKPYFEMGIYAINKIILGGSNAEPLQQVPDSAQVSPADTVLVSKTELNSIVARLDSIQASLSEPDNLLDLVQENPLGINLPEIGRKIAYSLFILLITFLLINAFVYVAEQIAERRPSQRLFYKRLIPMIRMGIWVLVFSYLAVSVFGSALLPAAAAIGVAVGFAAQDILKNIFGGLLIITDQPFQTGDRIRVGASYGEVVSIGLRSTRIQTLDDNLVTIPNSEVMASQVSNANAGELNCQVVTDLYLPGWVNEAEAKTVAYNVAASSKYLFRQKPIVVLVKDKYDHGFVTHLQVKAYVLDTRFESLFLSDVTERSRAEFRRLGLIPRYHGANTVASIQDQLGSSADSEEKGSKK